MYGLKLGFQGKARDSRSVANVGTIHCWRMCGM